ncbi:unnamed protein product [Rhizopus stolonifer]
MMYVRVYIAYMNWTLKVDSLPSGIFFCGAFFFFFFYILFYFFIFKRTGILIISIVAYIQKPYNNRPRRTTPNNNYNNSINNRTNNVGRPLASNRNSENSLVVSNLHFNVTEKDLYDLFGQIGKLRRAFLHIGPNGKSAGIADVVFVNSNDAERARVTYNNVQLDGRPMRITVASIIASVPTSAPRTSSRFNNNNNNNGRRSTRGNARRDNRSRPSQQDLDADMDSYMGVNNEDTQMN